MLTARKWNFLNRKICTNSSCEESSNCCIYGMLEPVTGQAGRAVVMRDCGGGSGQPWAVLHGGNRHLDR